MSRTLLALLIGGMLAAAAAALLWHEASTLDAPLPVSSPLRFKIPPGASFSRIAAQLAARRVITSPRAWIGYARFTHQSAAVKAGEYQIEPGMTPRELLRKLVEGQVVLHSFTIVDGWRVKELLTALRRNPDVASTLQPGAADLMRRLGEPGIDAEGQFLPQTYRFTSGTSDLELLRQAHTALTQLLQSAWEGRDPQLPLKSAYELLTMASIVEKESAVPQELAKIAGLYLRRLSLGMRLQADPTVIYGLGEHYGGEIHTVDLRTDGPYNTYTRQGLPPTPIALPGAAAIEATAHPQMSEAVYFVASPKDDGSHVFSATLAEHNAAVAAYLAHQRRKAAEGTQ